MDKGGDKASGQKEEFQAFLGIGLAAEPPQAKIGKENPGRKGGRETQKFPTPRQLGRIRYGPGPRGGRERRTLGPKV